MLEWYGKEIIFIKDSTDGSIFFSSGEFQPIFKYSIKTKKYLNRPPSQIKHLYLSDAHEYNLFKEVKCD